jgi:hypothetical protein
MGKRKKARKNAASTPRHVSRAPYIFLAAVLLFFAIARFRLRHMPLERDEGEYAYAGQLLLQGIPPYKLAYNMKLPGTYVAYAAIMALFGETSTGIHLGLLLVSAATSVIIFFLVKRLFDSTAAVVAAASYTLLVTSPSVLGFAGHATHFVVLGAVGGLLVLLHAINSKRIWMFFLSGVLLGLAFLMKQPGIFFLLFAAAYLIKSQWKPEAGWHDLAKCLSVFCCGAILPFALTCVWLWRAGVFQRFWFWTFTYARLYGTIVSLRDAPGLLWRPLSDVIGPAVLIWIIAGAGLAVIFWRRQTFDKVFFVIAFLLFSFLAVCPGFYFREHYFILLLPAVSLLVGCAVTLTAQQFRDRLKMPRFRYIPAAFFLIAFGYAIWQNWEFLFEMDPITACRSEYGANPFPEAVQIADFLKTHSSPSASIAVVGSEPEIYFYSHRHSATGYIYTYPLVEEQHYALTMQKEMISEIESARPEFLVLVQVSTSWLRNPAAPGMIFDWAQKYVTDFYEPAGLVEIRDTSRYWWGEDAKTADPVSPYLVRIFKRVSTHS